MAIIKGTVKWCKWDGRKYKEGTDYMESTFRAGQRPALSSSLSTSSYPFLYHDTLPS